MKADAVKTDPRVPTKRFSLMGPDGHYVILWATDLTHARVRWNEFNPHINPNTVQIVEMP